MVKMATVHGARWTNYYNQAPIESGVDPEEFANIFLKTENMFKRLKAERVSRGVKFIPANECPKERAEARYGKTAHSSGVKCQAITMLGKPCPFRATSGCGKFCKKHIIVE
jgi:hypothetical protein